MIDRAFNPHVKCRLCMEVIYVFLQFFRCYCQVATPWRCGTRDVQGRLAHQRFAVVFIIPCFTRLGSSSCSFPTYQYFITTFGDQDIWSPSTYSPCQEFFNAMWIFLITHDVALQIAIWAVSFFSIVLFLPVFWSSPKKLALIGNALVKNYSVVKNLFDNFNFNAPWFWNALKNKTVLAIHSAYGCLMGFDGNFNLAFRLYITHEQSWNCKKNPQTSKFLMHPYPGCGWWSWFLGDALEHWDWWRHIYVLRYT